jgi:hypothetical protein
MWLLFVTLFFAEPGSIPVPMLAPRDPALQQWHLMPTHSRKKSGNGWGTQLSVFMD